MTYHRDIDRNEINTLAQAADEPGSLQELYGSKASEPTPVIEALVAFRERAARLAESDHATTCHPHEQARVHHRVGADSARKAIAAKIRALPLLEAAQSHDGSFAFTDIDSAKRHLIVGGEL